MIDLQWCKDCDTYHLHSPPRHYPAFRVCTANEDEGHWRNIRAPDAQAAASKYAERWDVDSGDYTIARGNPEDFQVIDEAGRRHVVTVKAEEAETRYVGAMSEEITQ